MDSSSWLEGVRQIYYFGGMPKPPKDPANDPNVAAFRAILEKKKAARAAALPANAANIAAKAQKPRAKQQRRRRP